MKVVLVGTDHKKDEREIDVVLIYEGEDTWTFSYNHENFSISDLTRVMEFLKEEMLK